MEWNGPFDSTFKNNQLNNDQSFKENSTPLNFYRSLAAEYPNNLIILSPNGDVVSQTEELRSLLGFSPKHFTDVSRIISKKDRFKVETAYTRTLNGESELLEIDIKNQKGHFVHYFLILESIKNKEKEVDGIILFFYNMTEQVYLKNSLEQNQKHLEHAQQVAEIGSWEYVIQEDKIYCSDYFCSIFGIAQSESITMDTAFQVVHPEDYEKAFHKVNAAMTKGLGYTSKFRILHGENKDIRFIKVYAEVFLEDNIPNKILGVVKDETYEIQLENELIEQNEHYEYIFDHLTAGIWIKDAFDGNFTYASKGLQDILQIPLESLYNNPEIWGQLIVPSFRQEISEQIDQLVKGNKVQYVYKVNCLNGQAKWLLEQIVPRLDMNGQINKVFGLVIDITNEIKIKEELDYLAHHDSLTKLPNQSGFYHKMDLLLQKGQPFALMYLDIDRLHLINDSLGDYIGDEVLIEFANRLSSLLSKNSYLARLNSNDFIILVENYNDKDFIISLAESIIQTIEQPLLINGFTLFISTSIGICFFPDDGTSKLNLLENAHTALTQAKLKGKKVFQLYSSSVKEIPSLLKYELDRDMRYALENNEFELYFQPQVNPQGVLHGAETLIRWNHKKWGLVSPGDFIPIAEENHMINEISDWIIETVCTQLRSWHNEGYRVKTISINLPPIRFIKPGLVDLVRSQLELNNIPPDYLEFEITEGSILNREDDVLSTVKELKALGVRIAIDDFGTGYASLESLYKLQPDTIKIDQFFIRHLEPSNDICLTNGIVSSILHLGSLSKTNIVAEGVEEMEQLQFLEERDCNLIQGFLFSKPVPKREFETILKRGSIKLGAK